MHQKGILGRSKEQALLPLAYNMVWICAPRPAYSNGTDLYYQSVLIVGTLANFGGFSKGQEHKFSEFFCFVM